MTLLYEDTDQELHQKSTAANHSYFGVVENGILEKVKSCAVFSVFFVKKSEMRHHVGSKRGEGRVISETTVTTPKSTALVAYLVHLGL